MLVFELSAPRGGWNDLQLCETPIHIVQSLLEPWPDGICWKNYGIRYHHGTNCTVSQLQYFNVEVCPIGDNLFCSAFIPSHLQKLVPLVRFFPFRLKDSIYIHHETHIRVHTFRYAAQIVCSLSKRQVYRKYAPHLSRRSGWNRNFIQHSPLSYFMRVLVPWIWCLRFSSNFFLRGGMMPISRVRERHPYSSITWHVEMDCRSLDFLRLSATLPILASSLSQKGKFQKRVRSMNDYRHAQGFIAI